MKYKSSSVKTEAQAKEVVRVAKNAGLSAWYRPSGKAFECRVEQRDPSDTRRRVVLPPASEWRSLREELPRFIQFKIDAGDWRGNTPFGYRGCLERHVYDFPLEDGVLLGDMPVDKVTAAMLGAVLNYVRSNKPSGAKGLGRGTQDQIRSPLMKFYQYLIDARGFAGPNPADPLKKFMSRSVTKRQREGAYEHFDPAEASKILRVADKLFPRWKSLVAVQMFLGLRYGEAAALRTRDIDWKRQVVRIVRTWNDKGSSTGPTKSGIEREVPFDALGAPDEIEEILRAQVQFARTEADAHDWNAEQRALVFPNTVGRHHRNNDFNTETWAKLLAAAKIEYRHPHTLRHTFGTWCAMGLDAPELGLKLPGVPLPKLQTWMGHATLAETQRYLHPELKRGTKTSSLAGLFRGVEQEV